MSTFLGLSAAVWQKKWSRTSPHVDSDVKNKVTALGKHFSLGLGYISVHKWCWFYWWYSKIERLCHLGSPNMSANFWQLSQKYWTVHFCADIWRYVQLAAIWKLLPIATQTRRWSPFLTWNMNSIASVICYSDCFLSFRLGWLLCKFSLHLYADRHRATMLCDITRASKRERSSWKTAASLN